MNLQHTEDEALETAFAPLSGIAFESARKQVLKSGQSVLIAQDGDLIRVHPDGAREFIKKIGKPLPVIKGKTLTI